MTKSSENPYAPPDCCEEFQKQMFLLLSCKITISILLIALLILCLAGINLEHWLEYQKIGYPYKPLPWNMRLIKFVVEFGLLVGTVSLFLSACYWHDMVAYKIWKKFYV